MNTLPTEILQQIFEDACEDDGTAGRSLSLVSHDIRQKSRRAKMQYLSATTSSQILGLAALLKSLPQDQRHVSRLFVSIVNDQSAAKTFHTESVQQEIRRAGTSGWIRAEPRPNSDEWQWSQWVLQGPVILKAFYEILEMTAHSLKSLDAYIGVSTYLSSPLPTIRLPRLVEMNISSQFCSHQRDIHTAEPTQMTDFFPRLTRLRLSQISLRASDFVTIRTSAPALAHLYISQSTCYALGEELGIDFLPSRDNLLPTITSIIIEKRKAPIKRGLGFTGSSYYAEIEHCGRIVKSEKRVRAIGVQPSGPCEMKKLWLARNSGGKGCYL